MSPISEEWRKSEALATKAGLGGVSLYVFTMYAASFEYYWSRAPEIPAILGTAIVFLFVRWQAAYSDGVAGVDGTIERRSLLSIRGIAALLAWFYASFTVTNTLLGSSKIAPSMVAGAIMTLVAFAFVRRLGRRLESEFNNLLIGVRRVRRLLLRMSSVIYIYVLTDVLFATVYRLIAIHDPWAFNKTLASPLDFFYFSTVTIATLGYGDITPVSDVAKFVVCLELLVGILLLTGMLAVAISMSFADRTGEIPERPEGPRLGPPIQMKKEP